MSHYYLFRLFKILTLLSLILLSAAVSLSSDLAGTWSTGTSPISTDFFPSSFTDPTTVITTKELHERTKTPHTQYNTVRELVSNIQSSHSATSIPREL